MSPRRWPLQLTLLAVALVMGSTGAGPAQAAYQATVDVNDTAFDPVCLGFEDSYPEKMVVAAQAAYVELGYASRSYAGAAFTRAHTLARTVGDWGYYVHSHGDNYLLPDGSGRNYGFREDSGDCAQAVIYARDIAAKRAGRQSNLVFMSTCHNGESASQMPAAFAIEKVKRLPGSWNGPEFYVGYLGDAWDSDEWQFEAHFWDAIGPGYGAGHAFDVADAQVFAHALVANWWGSYSYTGRAGPLPPPCSRCL